MDLTKKIGQKMLIGFKGKYLDENFKNLIKKYKIGNVILFKDNIADKNQLRDLCEQLHKFITEQTGYPPFITIDQEGGVVTRLSDDCTNVPGAMAIAATDDPYNAYIAGKITGSELALLGVNVNFAPVLDVNSNPDNPVIGVRSYGENPEVVSEYASQMIEGLLSENVMPCGKHFPGHGDTNVDSHLGLPTINKSLEELENCELIPFKNTIGKGIPAIMSTHIIFSKIDDQFPGTLSRNIMTDLLKKRLCFEGLTFTDCLEMQAIQKEFGTPHGAMLSVKAGADIVCISKTPELQIGAALAIFEAVENGEISSEEIDNSVEKILEYKKKYAKLCSFHPELIGTFDNKNKSEQILEESITMVSENLPPLGENALFLGCLAYRSTIASSKADEKVVFVDYMVNFCKGEGKITPLNPTEKEIETIISDIVSPSCIVLGTYNGHINTGQITLANSLEKLKIPVVVVALRNPYDLSMLPLSYGKIAAYEYSPKSFEATASKLMGTSKATGKLPVTI